MTDQRGLSFMDAVKQLAEEAGMEVPAPIRAWPKGPKRQNAA
jgi:DNA primase